MKIDWQKIKEFDQEGLLPYVLPNYIADKFIFRICVLLIFAWIFFVFQSEGWDFKPNYYLECPATGGSCENPYYNIDGLSEIHDSTNDFVPFVPRDCPQEGLCSQKFIQAGNSIGNKPSWMFTHAVDVDFALLLFAILLNHFLYNRGYFKKKFKDLKEGD